MIVILTQRSGGGRLLRRPAGLEWLGFVSPSHCHQRGVWSLCGSEGDPHGSFNHGVSMPISTSLLPLLLAICKPSSLECVFGCPVLNLFFFFLKFLNTVKKPRHPFLETASERTHTLQRESRSPAGWRFRSGAVCVARLTQ